MGKLSQTAPAPPPNLLPHSNSPISPPFPSALTTARNIEDLSHVSYPEGVKCPKVELNVNTKDGKFRYDRDFLLQFMSFCKDKPDNLLPLDAIGLELTDQPFYMNRGSSSRDRQSSGALPPSSRDNPIGLGFTSGAAVFKGGPINRFNMGQFQTSKPTSEGTYTLITHAALNSGSSNNMQFRPASIQQLQGVPGTPTQTHALPAPHSASSHAPSNSIGGVTSPPATPSAASGRLKVTASAFVPGRKVIIKNPNDGQEVNLEALNKSHVAAQPPHSPGPSATNFKTANRRSVRVESEEARKKRLAEEDKEKEIQQSKREAVEKSKREQEMKMNEEEARRKKAEQETEAQRLKEEEERRRKAEEEERIRKEKEAEEAQKLRQAAEEKRKREEAARLEMEKRKQKEEEARLEMKKRKQEEEEARLEMEKRQEEVRLKMEKRQEEARLEMEKRQEEERLRKEAEETERLRKEAEGHGKAKAAEAAAAVAEETTVPAEKLEEGELEEHPTDHQHDLVRDKVKEGLRIDTSPPLAEPSRKRPDPLDLRTSSKSAISPPFPSALATARNIEDLSHVSYPEGVKSPKVELNVNAKDGKFRYDRGFLLQFMSVCKDKPDNLPPLDAIGLELTDQPFYMNRGSSGRNRQSSGALPPPSRGNPIGLGFTSGAAVFGPPKGRPINSFNMGQFQTSKPTSEERFALSTRAASNSGSKRESTSSLSRTNPSSNMFIVLGESDGPKPARPLSRKASDEMTPPPLSDGPPSQRKKLMLPLRFKLASEEVPPPPRTPAQRTS